MAFSIDLPHKKQLTYRTFSTALKGLRSNQTYDPTGLLVGEEDLYAEMLVPEFAQLRVIQRHVIPQWSAV
ncbi:hypothetical protein O9993_21310 [Vibrio lentus]|nr:hypothetical protein [Vibrio lentus]